MTSTIFVLLLAGLGLYYLDSIFKGRVEQLKGSLNKGSEDTMSVKEKCLYEYNLTLSFTVTMGRWATALHCTLVEGGLKSGR